MAPVTDKSAMSQVKLRQATLLSLAHAFGLAGSLFVTTSLELSYRFGAMLPCGGVGDCNALRYHPLNQLGFVRLPDFGMVASLALSILYLASLRDDTHRAFRAHQWLAPSFALINTLLVVYAKATYDILCTWCVLSAIMFWVVTGTAALSIEANAQFKRELPKVRLVPFILFSILALVLSGLVYRASVFDDTLPDTIQMGALANTLDVNLFSRERLVLGTGTSTDRILVFFDPFCPTCRELMLKLGKGWNRDTRADVYVVFAAMHRSKENLIACAVLAAARRAGEFWPVITRTGNGVAITSNHYLRSLKECVTGLEPSFQVHINDGTHDIYELIAMDEEIIRAVNLKSSPIVVEWPRYGVPTRLRLPEFHIKYGVPL